MPKPAANKGVSQSNRGWPRAFFIPQVNKHGIVSVATRDGL
jgi:hypothetical protein